MSEVNPVHDESKTEELEHEQKAGETKGASLTSLEEQTALNESPLHGLWAMTNRELKKWYKVPTLLLMSLIQPVIWLGLFGKAMNFSALFTGNSFTIPGLTIPQSVINQIAAQFMQNTFGTSDYFSFLSIGMLSFIVLFTSMFSGMSIVWDRRFGFLEKILSTPLARGSIVMGKVLSSVVRSLVQAAIVLVIAILLGMQTSHITVLGLFGTFSALFLLSFGFSSLFLMLALRSADWQTQMAIMNLLNLPLVFASNALFPSKFMPEWLQVIVKINPLSYAIDAGRQMLLGAAGTASLAFDFLYLSCFALLFASIGIILSWKILSR